MANINAHAPQGEALSDEALPGETPAEHAARLLPKFQKAMGEAKPEDAEGFAEFMFKGLYFPRWFPGCEERTGMSADQVFGHLGSFISDAIRPLLGTPIDPQDLHSAIRAGALRGMEAWVLRGEA